MRTDNYQKGIVIFFICVACLVLSAAAVAAKGQDEAAAVTGHSVPMSPGWDIFNDRLSSGEVLWKTVEGQGTGNLQVIFRLRGARPNHEYTVGVHLFNPTNLTARPAYPRFGGLEVGGEGVISREGKTAYVIAWDFGSLRTDSNGDGMAGFPLAVPQGTYHVQFTVRIGGAGTCHTGRGITHGCSAVYRTGGRFAQDFEIIDFAKSAEVTKGWDIFNDPLSSGRVNWDITGQGSTTNNLQLTYQLRGARPNHAYTVGVHFFNPADLTARPNVNSFDGWSVGGEGVINREGKTAYVIAWDFGGLQTDGNGNGTAQFHLSVPSGTYHLQYTIRIGGVGTCYTSQGITHGCSASYRTGNRFAEQIHTLRIP